MNESVLINATYFRNRLSELGLKQWWVADQIGVDRKTVSRWLQGQVRSAQIDNVRRLCEVLACQLNDVVLGNEADSFATVEDQKTAANIMLNSSLIEKLGAIGEWDAIEGLLRSCLIPSLSKITLCDLYNQLTIALWRQSKIDDAQEFCQKAEALSRSQGDWQLLGTALLSKANILCWKGRNKAAIETYREVLDLKNYISRSDYGSALSNLGALLYEVGDLKRGLEYLDDALECFVLEDKIMSQSINWWHKSYIYLQMGLLSQSLDSLKHSRELAEKSDYRRGLCACDLLQAELLSKCGDVKESKQMLTKAMTGYQNLKIEEGLNYEFAGRINRENCDYQESLASIDRGIAISQDFPLCLANLHFERAQTLRSLSAQTNEIDRHLNLARDLYLQSDAPLRAASCDHKV
ncbi:MAG: tetratricopeptide repeat protein [Proteobacteria bacterium]|nr:tetratricopeptide repeat protein [Pseudomonadota bacterium]